MSQLNGINTTKYHGLPGEEEYARRTYDQRFEELYSKDVNPESLYKAQISTFARFAKIHPLVAFLLEQLRLIYENLDVSLDMFKLNYTTASGMSRGSQIAATANFGY
jgi:hypothetical protein